MPRELITIGALSPPRAPSAHTSRELKRAARHRIVYHTPYTYRRWIGQASSPWDAAFAMNDALIKHGYKEYDKPLYSAFQLSVGLTDDGYPGTATMTQWRQVLLSGGMDQSELAPVKIYPWRSRPGTSGYDGVNAPTIAEWYGGAAPPSPGPIAPVTPGGAPQVGPPQPLPPVPVTPRPSAQKAGLGTGGMFLLLAIGAAAAYATFSPKTRYHTRRAPRRRNPMHNLAA